MKPGFGKLKKIKRTDEWKEELRDFTPWLHDEIEYLSDAIDLELKSKIRREEGGC